MSYQILEFQTIKALVPDSTIRSRTSKIKKTKTEYAEYFLKFPLNKLDLKASVPSFFHLVIITAASVGVARSPPPPVHFTSLFHSYFNCFVCIVLSLGNEICLELHSHRELINLFLTYSYSAVAQNTVRFIYCSV